MTPTVVVGQSLAASSGARITDMMGGWSILQNLDVGGGGGEAPVYVHPLVKRNQAALSGRSLEMCTESLGSETGSDDATCDLPTLPGPDRLDRERVLVSRRRRRRMMMLLPPPLPSISGVQVERVREGGRLVMRAVTVGPTHACFEAERGNGRLRLRLHERCVLRCGGGGGGDVSGDMDGILEKVEGENGENKYARATTSRCNEDDTRNREMLNLEAFWVAT